MQTLAGRPSRRAVLAFGAGTVLAAAVSTGGRAYAAGNRSPGADSIARALADLERQHAARLGVFARNTLTGRSVAYRADELFPICSVHKTITAAAVLRDLDRDGTFLARRIRYTREDVTAAGYAPITGTPGHLANGMTVAELCAAAIDYSDNAANNLLLRELGGPTAITRFCRSIGDDVTRLDRWEPALNSAEPGRRTDTTSPAAIGWTHRELVLGDALAPRDRRQLTEWLLADTTGAARLRAGLPTDWTLADKTGTGDYGTTNDVGIAWTPDGTPVVLSVLATKQDAAAPADEPLIARTAALLAAALT
ncbi:class A beta-lactamase [Kitasatospora sp. NBC_01287]|uniref:class A beta-lactamase n=1 Tax=Kitasatospora sp. NBC_01287 TaxID=2903573 RepID=UPI00224CA61A|nr:class A beta-lactamase [Kitasatospora sp. NBC_01287]MCX4744113.1 class A beta-lactamase [Kitasatospora sp. NBC_01287]